MNQIRSIELQISSHLIGLRRFVATAGLALLAACGGGDVGDDQRRVPLEVTAKAAPVYDRDDLYRFFSIAFGAAPGVTYMGQLVEAADYGLSIKQIVNIFTTKPQFLETYPATLSNREYAQKLVDNVVGTSASAAAKAEAVEDIVAALSLPDWTRGDITYAIFNNLAKKPASDIKWADTAKKMINQVTYAKHFTEVMKIDTTDLSKLRSVIRYVTEATETSVNLTTAIEDFILPKPQSYSIGGTAYGLSGTVTLQLNGTDEISISSNGSFLFSTTTTAGAAYAITVKTQPSGQYCTLDNNRGIALNNVANIMVSCLPKPESYTITGTASGLSGIVTLQLNGANDLTISTNGLFAFRTAVSIGENYTITVKTNPTGQRCLVANDRGTVISNVSNILVTCTSVPLANPGFGNRRILFTHAKYTDSATEPFPISESQTRATDIGKFFSEASYGASLISWDIKGWSTLPQSKNYYQSQDSLGNAAVSAAIKQAGELYDLKKYDVLTIAMEPLDLGYPGCYMAVRRVKSSGEEFDLPVVILSGQVPGCRRDADIAAHEIGHSYGFLHSSFIACNAWPNKIPVSYVDPVHSFENCDVSPNYNPNATFFEYAPYDVMGSYRGHPNIYWKQIAGWIPQDRIETVEAGQKKSITIEPIEFKTEGIKGVRIQLGKDHAGDQSSYWIEYRSITPLSLEPGVNPSGSPNTVKIWVNLNNLSDEILPPGGFSIRFSKIFSFSSWYSPTPTELRSGQSFNDPYRGLQVTRNANTSSSGRTAASITVTVSGLTVEPAVGAAIRGSAIQDIVVSNKGSSSITQGSFRIGGRHPSSFFIVSNGCSSITLPKDASCKVTVAHNRATSDTGTKFATLEWISNDALRSMPSIGLLGLP